MSDAVPQEVPFAGSIPSDAPFKLSELPLDHSALAVYEIGPVTVVGFGGQPVPDEDCIKDYREQLLDLIDRHNCHVIAFDLTGVQLLPSRLLAMIWSVRKLVEKVELRNPSAGVREVLRITQFDRMFDIKDGAM